MITTGSHRPRSDPRRSGFFPSLAGRVGSGRVGSGRVGSGGVRIFTGQAGAGQEVVKSHGSGGFILIRPDS